ncbi:MAG: hypothetical protein M3296_04245, partial [Actinomycetota bacterium]|nr:hypothetical protein [Actinomycetota bacterium]
MWPWRATTWLFIVWTGAMAVWLALYRATDATCGPEIYRKCQIGLKITTGLGRPGVVLLWALGVGALATARIATGRSRAKAVERLPAPSTSAPSAAGVSSLPRRGAPARLRGT